nr:UDP flavonoid: 3-O-glucosyltransferase [Ipomoea batatas]
MTRTCSTNCTVAVYLSGGVAIEADPDFCQKGNPIVCSTVKSHINMYCRSDCLHNVSTCGGGSGRHMRTFRDVPTRSAKNLGLSFSIEWEHHGMFSYALFDQVDYFTRGLQLLNRNNILHALQIAFSSVTNLACYPSTGRCRLVTIGGRKWDFRRVSIRSCSKLLMRNGLEQKLKVIPGMSELSIGEIPREILAKDLQVSFPGMIYNMALKLPGANAVVLNSFQKLEPTVTYDLRSKLQKVFNIGPMILQSSATPKPPIPDDHNCIPWLDSLPPASLAVYLSFGSGLMPPGDEIVALAEALEAKRVPFLLVPLNPTALSTCRKGFLNEPKNSGRSCRGPRRVGAFVTHCGWNSILEAIPFRVCMICRPFYGDQQINTRFVESVWEIGVKVEGGIFTKDETMKALSVVLDSDRGKQLKENVVKLKGEALEAILNRGILQVIGVDVGKGLDLPL